MTQHGAMTRLLSLDVFRGLTIALMVLVNSPGTRETYPWLEHAAWDGCTLADLVFPFFLVIVGISSVLALTHLKNKGVSNKRLFIKIIKRSAYLFMLGLLLNAFPHHLNFSDIRILGVLQRIAICYFFSSVLFLTLSIRAQGLVVIVLLVGYWILMACFPTSYPLTINHNLAGYIDRLIFSSNHLYTSVFDPEGLLSTIPSIASVLFGNFLGFWLTSANTPKQKLQWILFTGFILSALGWGISFICPFNKSLWSSSYVLFTSGLAYLGFACCFALIEMKQWSRWSRPFSLFGKHSLLVFVLHVLFLKIQAIILVSGTNNELVNLRLYITDLLFGHFAPQNASLLYAISYTLLWFFVLKCTEARNKIRGKRAGIMPTSS